jgi:cytochrome c-type biogenesis protein CcmE
MGPRSRLLFFGVLVTGAIVYFAVLAFQNATVSYASVDDVASDGPTAEGRTVGVSDKLVSGSYARSADGLVASFHLKDEDGSRTMPVQYSGEVGQVFFNEHSEIILKGALGADGVFSADTLTVRCPSKYLTEQERAEIAAQDSGQPVPPPYQPDYFESGA